jgi:YggT family protein
MFVLGNLIASLADLLNTVLNIYSWLLIARVLISWVSPDPFNPIVQFLQRASDPYLNLFRRFIPPIGMMDISPIIALLVLQFGQRFLVRTLLELSARL